MVIMDGVPNTTSSSEPNQNPLQPQQAKPVVPLNSQTSLHDNPQAAGAQTQPVKPIIRTFETDAALAMQHKKASVVKIAIAESKRQTQSETIGTRAVKQTISSVTKLLLALMFIGAGGAVFYYLYTQGVFDTEAPIVQTQTVPSIIDANIQKELNISIDRNVISAVTNIRKNSTEPVGSVTYVYFTQGEGELNRLIDSRTFFTIINSHAPDSLIRSLRPEFMFGFHESLANEPFLILKTDSFQNTFAGMLAWEKVMLEDVDDLFAPIVTRTNTSIEVTPATSTSSTTGAIATSTASTTPREFTTKDFLDPKAFFEDLVIRNKDVRALRSTTNQTLLLYTFIDPQTLVLTPSEMTLREILDRVEKKVYER